MRRMAVLFCVMQFGLAPLALAALGSPLYAEEVARETVPEKKSAPPAHPTAAHPATAHPEFDWSEWRRLPVQHDGRIKPLDSLADELVNIVTGRSKWSDPDVKDAVAYRAPELLYCWITRPDEWIDRPILRCEFRPLRKILNTDKVQIPIEGTFVSLGQILDWQRSNTEGHPVFWSKDLEERLQALEKSPKNPDSVGDTAESRAINGKVAELFRHLQSFLNLRRGSDVFVVPGLDPRALTRQTNPEEQINAWVSLGPLLAPDKWKTEDDLTIAALMAENPRELASDLLSRRFPDSHPNHPRNIVTILPQLAQAQKVKGTLLPEIRQVKEALEQSREAYDAADATAFASSMHAFVAQIRRLAQSMETARAEMGPIAKELRGKKSIDFGEVDGQNLNDIVWGRYEPLALSDAQMRFSSYPRPGSTNVEILYNQYQPFRTAWIVFLTALVVIVLSGMLKSSRLVFATGLAISLAAITYSAWGFAMRITIAGRPPVTNMYETVIWASFVVSILGLWFCLIPFTWPGLSWGWRVSGLPFRVRAGHGLLPRVELDRHGTQDDQRFLGGWHLPIQCAASLVRLAAFAATVWFFTRSGTSFRIIEFAPPVYGKGIAWSSLGTWLVGMSTVVLCAWFGSRAAVALALFPAALVPEAHRQGDRPWEQTFQRRYFLMGALPVACFGMMLAHFVGMSSPDIFNPRIGSITAVLRNNYWLTIHVLTIVSSYGAGGLAWGLGNLAMLFYLFGKYRHEDATPHAALAAHSGGPIFDLDEAYGNKEGSIVRRLTTAGKALQPRMLPRTLKAGFQDFGTGDQHLEKSKVLPPKEVATLASYTYKAQQVAVLLLAAGTILGGLWADVSWGRFWDWDPKEVWALISLLAYLVVLHGRFAGWVGTFGTNLGGVLAFSAILFSWYGVNFVLPMVHGWLKGTNMPTEVGLHAYAVGSGGLGYVAGAVLINLIFVTAAWARYAAETTNLLTRSKEGAATESG